MFSDPFNFHYILFWSLFIRSENIKKNQLNRTKTKLNNGAGACIGGTLNPTLNFDKEKT